MKAVFNDRELDIFSGATIADLLRLCAPDELRAVKAGRKTVINQDGDEVDLTGPVSERNRYTTREIS